MSAQKPKSLTGWRRTLASYAYNMQLAAHAMTQARTESDDYARGIVESADYLLAALESAEVYAKDNKTFVRPTRIGEGFTKAAMELQNAAARSTSEEQPGTELAEDTIESISDGRPRAA